MDEARHELGKRVAVIVGQGRMTDGQGEQLLGVVRAFVEGGAIEIVARQFYEHMEATARRRVPRDPANWAPDALALALGILTGDHDFLGLAARPGRSRRSWRSWEHRLCELLAEAPDDYRQRFSPE